MRQIKINVPADISDWIDQEARNNMRSKNSEIVFALKEKMMKQAETKEAPARS